MGELLIALDTPDTSFADIFGTPYSLTHRGVLFTCSPFKIGEDRGQRADQERVALTVSSMLGRMVGQDFRGLTASQVSTNHTESDLKEVLSSGKSFLAGIVAMHLAALGAKS